MRLSWWQLVENKLHGKSKFLSVGIAITADSVLVCALKKTPQGITWELDASFTHQQWLIELKSWVNQHNLYNTPCCVAFTTHWYQMLQIDAPNVNVEELYDALQWPLKDILPDTGEYTYDFTNLPMQVSGQNKLNVVAISNAELEKISQGVNSSGLVLENISVEEQTSMELLCSSEDALLTLAQEHGEEIVLNIVKNGELYFTRRLKGFENLGSFSEEELRMGIVDSLCVQLQRSMDFYESQLRQAPIKCILLKLDTALIDELSIQIKDTMEIQTEIFVPNIDCSPHLNFKMASYTCLGAAMSVNDVKRDTHNTKKVA